MNKLFQNIYILSTLLLLLTPALCFGVDSWRDSSGREISFLDLQKQLQLHREWVESDGKNGKPIRISRANLSGLNLANKIQIPIRLDKADLKEINLNGVNLKRVILGQANLEGAQLVNANLSHGILTGTNLSKTLLSGTDLSGALLNNASLKNSGSLEKLNLTEATLQNTDLTGSFIIGANFTNATLLGSILNNAHIEYADFSGADLTQAELNNAWLFLSDFHRTIFEPKSNPMLRGIASSKHLEFITYRYNPDAIVALRKEFKDSGFREQERKLTYALKARQADMLRDSCRNTEDLRACFEYWFNYLLFDFTCQYGMSPGKPLRLIGGNMLLFSMFYMLAIATRGRGGIWACWLPDRLDNDGSNCKSVRVTEHFFLPHALLLSGVDRGPIIRLLRVLRFALYFSLLSTFHFGWRDLNVGTWLSRIQSREYTLRPTGWIRTVSGLQSLISVYLLALCVLTYFGRPFE